MALSNIFREPRREITESAVGIAVLGAAIWADYEFALWCQDWVGYRQSYDGSLSAWVPWPFGMALGVVLAGVTLAALFVTHALGDGICNALQARGVHLRPQNRPRG